MFSVSSLAAGTALVVFLALLGLGKKPKKLFISRPLGYRALESPALVLSVTESEDKPSDINSTNFAFQSPSTPKERLLLQKKLKKLKRLKKYL